MSFVEYGKSLLSSSPGIHKDTFHAGIRRSGRTTDVIAFLKTLSMDEWSGQIMFVAQSDQSIDTLMQEIGSQGTMFSISSSMEMLSVGPLSILCSSDPVNHEVVNQFPLDMLISENIRQASFPMNIPALVM